MTRSMPFRWLTGLAAAALLCAAASAQDEKPSKKYDTPKANKAAEPPKGGAPAGEAGEGPGAEMEEMMKRCMEAGTPADAHKKLAALAGKWDYEGKFWMPGAPEGETFKGTGEYKVLFDGRYLQQDVGGNMDGPDGQPMTFRGMGLMGFDNMKKQYFSTWIDNMSTGLMVGWGTADAAGKVITYTGEGADPMSGNLHQKFRNVVRIEGPDKHVFEMHGPGPDGKEYKQMEIVYTRVKQ